MLVHSVVVTECLVSACNLHLVLTVCNSHCVLWNVLSVLLLIAHSLYYPSGLQKHVSNHLDFVLGRCVGWMA